MDDNIIAEKIAEAAFDAALSNIALPGTDNIEIRRLKKRIKILYIIIVALLILLVIAFIVIIALIFALPFSYAKTS